MSTTTAPAESAAASSGAGRRMITDVEPLSIPAEFRANSLVELVHRTVQRYPDKEALRWKLPRTRRQMGGSGGRSRGRSPLEQHHLHRDLALDQRGGDGSQAPRHPGRRLGRDHVAHPAGLADG